MLSAAQNERLTRVGPGTPMGTLMRRYWQPIAPVEELGTNPRRAMKVRLLGEDLVLFRDRSGRLGLVDRACSHRRMNLAYGIVEEDGIRCPYHGWKFSVSGECIEQPFEQTVRPDSQFRQRCGIASYPVEELAGLVWAYLGPDPVPLLPRWSPLVIEEAVRDITMCDLPCNWLQCQENSLDPVHTEWLHRYMGDYIRAIYGLDDGTRFQGLGPTAGNPTRDIRFYDFEYGMAKCRLVEGDTGDEEDWTIGHPILFPNTLVSGCQFSLILQFRVPTDDVTTRHITLYVFPAAPGTKAPQQKRVPYRYPPMKLPNGEWNLNHNFNQDYMAWVEQGTIAERDKERLGASDRGVIRYRQMLESELKKMERGEEPMNVFRDPAKNVCLEFPIENIKHRMFTRPLYKPANGKVSGVAGDVGYSADTDLIEATLATWDTIPLHAMVQPPGDCAPDVAVRFG